MCRFLRRWWFGRSPAEDEPKSVRKPEPPPPEIVEPEEDEPMDPPPPKIELPFEHEPDEPVRYANHREYLHDELKRIDLLVKAFLIRRQVRAQSSDPVRNVTAIRFDWLDPVVDVNAWSESDRLVEKSRRCETEIVQRLRLTEDRARTKFPLWELTRAFQLVPSLAEVVPAFGRSTNVRPVRNTASLDVLLLSLLAERFPRYLAALNADGSTGLAADAALDVVDPGAEPNGTRWDLFAADRPLIQNGLIELEPASPHTRRTLRIDSRTADYLLEVPNPGLNLAGVRVVSTPRPWDDILLDRGPRELLEKLATRWWDRTQPLRFAMMLHGPAGSPFVETAEAFLSTPVRGVLCALPFLLVDAPVASRTPDWEGFLRRLYQESLYRRNPVVLLEADVLLATDQPHARWESLIRAAEASTLPTFIASETPWDPSRSFHAPGHYFVRVELPVPTAVTRRAIWVNRLSREENPLAADESPAQKIALDLIETFQFTHGQIDDAMATARGLALVADPSQPIIGAEHLYESCRRQSARRLVSFANRIQPRLTEEESKADPKKLLETRVVLPPAAAAQLQELFERMRTFTRVYHDLGFEQRLHLGRGLVALFSGSTGTGKTLAATTLAALNGKDLYRVDMAAVVSKFVGETEKNLGRVFADAQDANAVLFFDEADALFGKRGSVEQGQDRWANLEVNYLLQRVEEYTGTVILATNIRENIDEAFLRRIQVLLDFPRPDKLARRNILMGMFPPRVKRPSDDKLEEFAQRFDVTGGNIKNAVLDAAFRAVASAGGSHGEVEITDQHLALGFAREYQKLGLPVSQSAFGLEYFNLAMRELRLDGPRPANGSRRNTG